MPPPVVALYTAEITMRGIAAAAGGNAVNIDNVFHFQRSNTTNPLSKANVEAAFDTAIAAPIIAALNVRYTQSFNTVRMLENATDVLYQNARAGAGAITGDSMPSENSAYLNVRTQYRGRNYRGSKKLGPMSESDSTTTSDVWNAGALTRLGAIASALLAGFTDSDGNVWTFGILSRALSVLTVNPTTVEWSPAISIQVRKSIGAMRRRKIKSVY